MTEHRGLPPMDSTWWHEYDNFRHACATTVYRLINAKDNPLTIEEVFEFGMFLGMTSRIQAMRGKEEE
jgi:hypothetical protein